MGTYKYMQKLWKKPKESLGPLWKERLMQWRREPVTLRLAGPTRLDRARSVGYVAKQGIFVVRQKVTTGPHRRTWTGGRMSKNMRTIKALRKSYQLIAEERASKGFSNCEVMNSYWLANDSKHYWYEVVMVERNHPVVLADVRLRGLATTGRVFHGRTSAGKKSRGLRSKGMGSEKMRPSRRSNYRRA